jgi:hypothetical protein
MDLPRRVCNPQSGLPCVKQKAWWSCLTIVALGPVLVGLELP